MILAVLPLIELVPGHFELMQVFVPDFLIFVIITKHICFSLQMIGPVEST